jgi:hypothetical protein
MQNRWGVEFGEPDNRIEIVYWIDERGDTEGEAYFRADDMCAKIEKGEFRHPFHGGQYRLYVPFKGGKSKTAVLQVLQWKNVGMVEPVSCTL